MYLILKPENLALAGIEQNRTLVTDTTMLVSCAVTTRRLQTIKRLMAPRRLETAVAARPAAIDAPGYSDLLHANTAQGNYRHPIPSNYYLSRHCASLRRRRRTTEAAFSVVTSDERTGLIYSAG